MDDQLVNPAGSAAEPESLSDQDGKIMTRGRIAVVEDDDLSRHFLVTSLRANGYHVKGIEDGASAPPLLRVHRPDLILLDVSMPGMNGFEVCRAIRRDPLLRHAIVILLTGRATPTDRMAGWSAGADDYLIKPCELSELLARVAAHLRYRETAQRQWLNPITGLPAPAALEEELLARVRRGDSIAAVYADIEHFKSYNDRYGFLAGDALLKVMADILREIAGDLNASASLAGDLPLVLAGHLGSDDFLLVVPPERALAIAATLARRFSDLAPALYRAVDRDRGWVPGLNRAGGEARFPLVTLTLATVVRHPTDLFIDEAGQPRASLAGIAGELWRQLRAAARPATEWRDAG